METPELRKPELLCSTLRDGRQLVRKRGDVFKVRDPVRRAVEYAQTLHRFGVRHMDAGVPAATQDGGIGRATVEAVARAMAEQPDFTVMGFTRGKERDIASTVSAVSHAARSGVLMLVSLSNTHLAKYRGRFPVDTPDDDIYRDMLTQFEAAARLACSMRDTGEIDVVHAYLEDATRMDDRQRAEVSEAMIDAGVDMLCLPDTLGVTDEHEYVEMFRDTQDRLGSPRTNAVLWGAHCHSDFANAEANTMAAARAGVAQVLEGTFGGGGPGEGLGNADLNVIVYQLLRKRRRELAPHLQNLGLTPQLLYELNQQASQVLGRHIPPNAPLVGSKAQRQTGAGIHQDGVAKERRENGNGSSDRMYFHSFTDFGVPDRPRFAVTDMSGRSGLREAMHERGITTDGMDLVRAYNHAIRMAKYFNYELTDDRLQAIAWEASHPEDNRMVQVDLDAIEGDGQHGNPMSIPIEFCGEQLVISGTGKGALGAFNDALNKLMKHRFGIGIDITYFDEGAETEAATEGEKHDAVVIADTIFRVNGDDVTSFGFDENQVYASLKACLLALNIWLDQQSEELEELQAQRAAMVDV